MSSNDYKVCLTVIDCDGNPVENAEVGIFDVDPLQDDDLETGVTDGNGQFCSPLDPALFKKTPSTVWFSEGGAGPNLYFRVKKGSTILEEDGSAGWGPEREAHPGQTLNVTLRLCDKGQDKLLPRFTHVCQYEVAYDGQERDIVDDLSAPSRGLTNKLSTNHVGYAFHNTLELRGQVPASFDGNPVEYRFLWNNSPIKDAMIADCVIGYHEIVWHDKSLPSPLPPASKWATQLIVLSQSAPSTPQNKGPSTWPTPLKLAPDPNGWISLPQGMTMGTTLLCFNTKAAVPVGTPSTNSVGTPGILTFQARDATNQSIIASNSQALVISNSEPMHTLNIVPTPCDSVVDELDLNYFFDHPYAMENWGLYVNSPASSNSHDATSDLVFGPRGGSGTHTVQLNPGLSYPVNTVLAAWSPCVYEAKFKVQLRLTDGCTDDPPRTRTVAFCKCQ
jgi:hypothetical protein